MTPVEQERAFVIGDRTLEARLAEPKRTAALTLSPLLTGAALVAFLLAASPPNALLYTMHLSVALGAAACLGALELHHERALLSRELTLGVSPEAQLAGRRRALFPFAVAQGVLICLPYLPFGTDQAPPGWLFLVTLIASVVGLPLGFAAGVAPTPPASLKLIAGAIVAQLLLIVAIVNTGAPDWLGALTPATSLGWALTEFERGLQDSSDFSKGFLLSCAGAFIWHKLAAWIALRRLRSFATSLRPSSEV